MLGSFIKSLRLWKQKNLTENEELPSQSQLIEPNPLEQIGMSCIQMPMGHHITVYGEDENDPLFHLLKIPVDENGEREITIQ
jgi:hypothetical protein